MSIPERLAELKPAFMAVGSNAEKGRALERHTGDIWARLGYRKVTFNTHATGEEIDVLGSHVVSGDVLKGQCKAYAAAVDSPPLRLFLGDVQKERGRNSRITGVFIALAGYTGTAIRWYEELSDEQKQWFRLLDGGQFLGQLEEAGLVSSRDALVAKWSQFTKLNVSSRRLLVTEHGPYWMVGLADADRDDAYYFFSTGNGDPPREGNIEYLADRVSHPAAGARMTLLRGREAIVHALLVKN